MDIQNINSFDKKITILFFFDAFSTFPAKSGKKKGGKSTPLILFSKLHLCYNLVLALTLYEY